MAEMPPLFSKIKYLWKMLHNDATPHKLLTSTHSIVLYFTVKTCQWEGFFSLLEINGTIIIIIVIIAKLRDDIG